MSKKYRASETVTENIFRDYYGATTFIEKSAIPLEYEFSSKSGNSDIGYPDFFRDVEPEYVIVVEAKATNHSKAKSEVQFYMTKNAIMKDIIGIAVSGQDNASLKVNYYPGFSEKHDEHRLKPHRMDIPRHNYLF